MFGSGGNVYILLAVIFREGYRLVKTQTVCFKWLCFINLYILLKKSLFINNPLMRLIKNNSGSYVSCHGGSIWMCSVTETSH